MNKKIVFLPIVLISLVFNSCSLHKAESTIGVYNTNKEQESASVRIRPYFQSVGFNRFVNIDTMDIRQVNLERSLLIQDSVLIDFLTDKILHAQFHSEIVADKNSYQWFKDSFCQNNPRFYYLGEMSVSTEFHSLLIGVFEHPNPFYVNMIVLVNETDEGFVSIAILSEDADVPEMHFIQNCRFNPRKKILSTKAKRVVLFNGKTNVEVVRKKYRICYDGRIYEMR